MEAISTELSVLDIVIFLLTLLATAMVLVLGQGSQKRAKSPQNYVDYILMGRRLTLPFFVATLVATWYGGIFGVTAIAFEQGIFNFVTQGIFWYLSYIIFAFFLIDRVRDKESLTLPDVVGRLYGTKAARIAAFFNLINVVPISYTISIGLLISTLTGWALVPAMIVGTITVCLYSSVSGFRSIVLTDLVQFVVMCTAVAFVLVFSVSTYGGISYLQNNLPEHYFQLTGKDGWMATAVWGFIALGTLIDPNFYQRSLAADSTATAKKGILISTVVWCLFDLCTTFGAMYARVALPEAEPHQAYMTYALDLLPTGWRGLFLAGLLATVLSTLDSYLFLATNTWNYDICRTEFKRSRQTLTLFLMGAFSIAMAQIFDGNIKLVWKMIGSISTGALLIPVLFGYFKKKQLTDGSFLISVFFSIIAMSLAWILKPKVHEVEIEAIYFGFAAGALSLIFCSKFDIGQEKT